MNEYDERESIDLDTERMSYTTVAAFIYLIGTTIVCVTSIWVLPTPGIYSTIQGTLHAIIFVAWMSTSVFSGWVSIAESPERILPTWVPASKLATAGLLNVAGARVALTTNM